MGQELLLSNEEYYNGFSRNDLDFKLQKKGATMEEYKAFAVEQAEDFAQEEMVAEDFIEVFGDNTDYVIDPEECMADNFGYALTYGMDGPTGGGYPNPEIIEGIFAILSGGSN